MSSELYSYLDTDKTVDPFAGLRLGRGTLAQMYKPCYNEKYDIVEKYSISKFWG